MARRRRKVSKTGPVWSVSALEATRLKKPRYNGFACGHGICGDTKYNRSKAKRQWQREKEASERGLSPIKSRVCPPVWRLA